MKRLFRFVLLLAFLALVSLVTVIFSENNVLNNIAKALFFVGLFGMAICYIMAEVFITRWREEKGEKLDEETGG